MCPYLHHRKLSSVKQTCGVKSSEGHMSLLLKKNSQRMLMSKGQSFYCRAWWLRATVPDLKLIVGRHQEIQLQQCHRVGSVFSLNLNYDDLYSCIRQVINIATTLLSTQVSVMEFPSPLICSVIVTLPGAWQVPIPGNIRFVLLYMGALCLVCRWDAELTVQSMIIPRHFGLIGYEEPK
ncbi:hypothetical protein M426DRAFT_149461 [Hypoxylon sp. CI-4A]|nr:hypothetical protein M426DRAFT_149461 [Hypoxylon sp. CI-4A]